MLLKLPSININKIQTHYTATTEEYWAKILPVIENLFLTFESDYSIIQSKLESLGLLFIGSKEIKFKCTCSHERMAHGIWSIIKSSGINQVFLEDETEIETKCDYCKKTYVLKKEAFLN